VSVFDKNTRRVLSYDVLRQKSPFSRTVAHIFVSPEDAPAIITQYVAYGWKEFNACQTTRSMYPSIFNSFPVIRTAKWLKKNNFTYRSPHFCFPWTPGDASATITQYVSSMERQCNACQTRRSMYLYDGAIKKFCNSL